MSTELIWTFLQVLNNLVLYDQEISSWENLTSFSKDIQLDKELEWDLNPHLPNIKACIISISGRDNQEMEGS
jgi:hypothetical protein